MFSRRSSRSANGPSLQPLLKQGQDPRARPASCAQAGHTDGLAGCRPAPPAARPLLPPRWNQSRATACSEAAQGVAKWAAREDRVPQGARPPATRTQVLSSRTCDRQRTEQAEQVRVHPSIHPLAQARSVRRPPAPRPPRLAVALGSPWPLRPLRVPRAEGLGGGQAGCVESSARRGPHALSGKPLRCEASPVFLVARERERRLPPHSPCPCGRVGVHGQAQRPGVSFL